MKPKPTVQCFCNQAHGHTSANCNKKPVCTKTRDTPVTCANCMPCSTSFPKQKNTFSNKSQIPQQQSIFTHIQYHQFPNLPFTNTSYFLTSQSIYETGPRLTYAKALTPQNPPQNSLANEERPNRENIEQIQSSDIDLFLRIINFIQKSYQMH